MDPSWFDPRKDPTKIPEEGPIKPTGGYRIYKQAGLDPTGIYKKAGLDPTGIYKKAGLDPTRPRPPKPSNGTKSRFYWNLKKAGLDPTGTYSLDPTGIYKYFELDPTGIYKEAGRWKTPIAKKPDLILLAPTD